MDLCLASTVRVHSKCKTLKGVADSNLIITCSGLNQVRVQKMMLPPETNIITCAVGFCAYFYVLCLNRRNL